MAGDPAQPEPGRDGAVSAAVKSRRMCRDFLPDPLAAGTVDGLLDLARRAPSAGFTQGLAFVTLERPSAGGGGDGAPDPVAAYWDLTLPAPRRSEFAWPGLLAAPALVTLWVRPQAWVERYARADKTRAQLGGGEEAWPVPYWWVDAGAVVQNLLLLAEADELGALFFGMFEHEPAVAAHLAVPAGWRGVGTVALGRPAPGGRRPSRSARAGRPPLAEQRHRGRWAAR
ncbi:MAG: nitroreductase family protein [Microthrixaceae bacterium]